MSPLKINLLLRLAVYAQPFEGLPLDQIHAWSMRDAFGYFRSHRLLADGVTHQSICDEPRPVMGTAVVSRLTEKGQRLVLALQDINPEDVP